MIRLDWLSVPVIIATDIGRLKVLIQVSIQIRLVVSMCDCITNDIGILKYSDL